MGRVWEDLRSERQTRSLSLETIGARTKIPERHLRALEEGRLADLPGGVFRRGIVRGYLQALGMGPEPWMQRFEACLAELPAGNEADDLALFAEGVRRSRPVVERRSEALRWPGVVAMLVVLLLFGWCVWRYALRGRLLVSTTRGAVSVRGGAARHMGAGDGGWTGA